MQFTRMGKHHKTLMDGYLIATTTPQCLSVPGVQTETGVPLFSWCLAPAPVCVGGIAGIGAGGHGDSGSLAAHNMGDVTPWHPSSSQHKTSLSVLCLYLSFLLRTEQFLYDNIFNQCTNAFMHGRYILSSHWLKWGNLDWDVTKIPTIRQD